MSDTAQTTTPLLTDWSGRRGATWRSARRCGCSESHVRSLRQTVGLSSHSAKMRTVKGAHHE